MAESKGNTIRKMMEVLQYEKSEITSIYFYAILSGLVQLSLPLGIQSIISFVIGGSISTSLIVLILLVIAGVVITGLLQVNKMKLIEKIEQQLFVRYSFKYAFSIPKLDLQSINGYYLPELSNRFFDTVSLQKGISKILLDIPAAMIQILFGLLLLSFYHPIFIFFGLLLLSVLFLILRTTGNRGLETSIEESNYKYKVAGYIQELARVVVTFKFTRNSSSHLTKMDNYVSGYLKARTAHFKILLFQYWTLIIFKSLIVMAMLVVGAFLLVNQLLNIGQFIAAEMVILMVIESVEKLIVNLDKVYDVLTSVEKINKLIDKPKEETGKLQYVGTKGISIRANNVTYNYPDGQFSLHNISFDIESGEKVCIMGEYSAGKSTLIKILSGAYISYEGVLFFDGISLSTYHIDSVRRKTGVLLTVQDIMEGTIKENICLGDDSITYHHLNEIAELVGLRDFIDSHKEGYDYYLQPTGQHLSGRIVRKVLLMRSLIHRPNLLLLEEPWQGLEEPNIQRIKNYLLHTIKDKTVVVVSNDKQFADSCDKVIVMEKGTIKSIIKK